MLTGLLAAMSAVNAQTVEHPVSASVNLDYRSRCLFSGMSVSTGSVLQPGVAFGYNDFSLNAYASYDADTDEINEGGFYAGYYSQYSKSAGVYVGIANFNYKHFKEAGKWASTYEFKSGLVTSLPGNPELHYVRDFSLAEDGQARRLALSHEVPARCSYIRRFR